MFLSLFLSLCPWQVASARTLVFLSLFLSLSLSLAGCLGAQQPPRITGFVEWIRGWHGLKLVACVRGAASVDGAGDPLVWIVDKVASSRVVVAQAHA